MVQLVPGLAAFHVTVAFALPAVALTLVGAVGRAKHPIEFGEAEIPAIDAVVA
jgi:hypothetical protein